VVNISVLRTVEAQFYASYRVAGRDEFLWCVGGTSPKRKSTCRLLSEACILVEKSRLRSLTARPIRFFPVF
jgi:hypothetical protein